MNKQKHIDPKELNPVRGLSCNREYKDETNLKSMSGWSSNGWKKSSNLKKKSTQIWKKCSDVKKKKNSDLDMLVVLLLHLLLVRRFELLVWWFLVATPVAEDALRVVVCDVTLTSGRWIASRWQRRWRTVVGACGEGVASGAMGWWWSSDIFFLKYKD